MWRTYRCYTDVTGAEPQQHPPPLVPELRGFVSRTPCRRLTGIETIFLMAAESNTHLSSSLIRELARWKKTIPGFVPESIADEVFARMGVPYEHAPPATVK